MAPFNWALLAKTVAAVAGLLLFLGGLTDLALLVRGEGGRLLIGAGAVALGLALLAYPVVVGVREAIAVKRREG